MCCICHVLYQTTKKKRCLYVYKRLLKLFKNIALECPYPFSHIIIKTFVYYLNSKYEDIPKCAQTFFIEKQERYFEEVYYFLNNNKWDKWVFGYLVVNLFKIDLCIFENERPHYLYYNIVTNSSKIIYLKYQKNRFILLIPEVKINKPHFVKPYGMMYEKENIYNSQYSINNIPLINGNKIRHYREIKTEKVELYTIKGCFKETHYVFINKDECVGYFNPKTSKCNPYFYVNLKIFNVDVIKADSLEEARNILETF